MLTVTFHGVRGSAPCPGTRHVRYGGNTACVVVEAPGEDPLVLDLGTGLRSWNTALASVDGDPPLRASALLSHLHWDHIQGLPFFAAADRRGAQLDVYGPGHAGRSLADCVNDVIGPPYFPLRTGELRGEIRFHELVTERVTLGGAVVTARPIAHRGTTYGYRVDWAGASVAYLSDHQAPPALDRVDDDVLELAGGVDLLIHDAQYTVEEWRTKGGWGHSTMDYAVLVATEAGARRLALFHHDPDHDDDQMDRLAPGARRTAERLGAGEVFAAVEGLVLTLGPAATDPRP